MNHNKFIKCVWLMSQIKMLISGMYAAAALLLGDSPGYCTIYMFAASCGLATELRLILKVC